MLVMQRAHGKTEPTCEGFTSLKVFKMSQLSVWNASALTSAIKIPFHTTSQLFVAFHSPPHSSPPPPPPPSSWTQVVSNP